MLKFVPIRCLIGTLVALLGVAIVSLPVQAESIDAYVLQYLQAKEPVPMAIDDQGHTRLVSPDELSAGKHLFEAHCKNCHVGGATLPNPLVSLSLADLAGAEPARDNINSLVAYQRHPMTYDGTEESFWCREVPESWMSNEELETLAAFVLRAAQKAPGWGSTEF